jgi:raffinose/stachyose/melibiose transport system permease protein
MLLAMQKISSCKGEMNDMKQKLAKLPGRIIVFLYALIVLVPLYFAIVTSLKSSAEITINPFGVPSVPMFENFSIAVQEGNLFTAFRNSVIVGIGATIMQMLFGIVISYCLHKTRDSKLSNVVSLIILATMFLPGTGWVTLIRLYQKIGLYNSIWGVLINGGTARLAFNVFILTGAMRAVPRDLEEAALLDGVNDSQYLFQVLLACIKPSVISVGIFAFTSVWNTLMTPLLLLRDSSAYTLPLALKYFTATDGLIRYNYVFAGIIISGLPLIIAYLCCQKYFVAALTGSVKG